MLHMGINLLGEWWGDWSSVGGLATGVVGFALTLSLLVKSKSAAIAAKEASEQARGDIRRLFSAADIAEAIREMRDLKAMHQGGNWPGIQAKYTGLRILLARIKGENATLTEQQRRDIQSIITQVSILEEIIEESCTTAMKPELARWNAIISRQLDLLVQLSVSIKFGGDSA
jgi:hypothetical protein